MSESHQSYHNMTLKTTLHLGGTKEKELQAHTAFLTTDPKRNLSQRLYKRQV